MKDNYWSYASEVTRLNCSNYMKLALHKALIYGNDDDDDDDDDDDNNNDNNNNNNNFFSNFFVLC